MERAQKIQQVQQSLWVILAIAILIVLSFFLTTWSRFNGADVAREQLIGYYAFGDVGIEITVETFTHYAAGEKTEYIITAYADDMAVLDANTLFLERTEGITIGW